jgi:zinc protease
MALFAELRRRNVLKVALLYAVASWLILWFIQNTADVLGLPTWTDLYLKLLLLIGFPVVLLFAWTYEITPGGLRKAIVVDQTQSIVYKTGQKLNAAVSVLLVLGVLALLGEGLLPKFEFLVPAVPQGDAPVSDKTPPEIRSLVLDNGLKIIVWPDHDNPSVAMYNFVRAGGRNESPGVTGISHFLETMMSLGTEELGPGAHERIIAAAGGWNYAYTSNDVTVYASEFPRSALSAVFEVEANRFETLQISPALLEAGRQRVYSKRRLSVADNDFGMLYEQVRAAAFVAHPYQFPVVGWPSDIGSLTEEDLGLWYQTHYAPNNRAMVFSGNVTAEEIFELSVKYFVSLPAQDPPPSIRTVEPQQQGPRRVLVNAPVRAPLLHIAFHAGSAADASALPLKLLLNILVGNESSRLHRLLVEEEELALSVDGFQEEGLDPGLIYFYLTLPPDGDPAVVEQRILEELQRVIDRSVTDAELEDARLFALTDLQQVLSTNAGRANALGNYELFRGGYESLFAAQGALAAVTTVELRDSAANVFRSENVTVGVLRETEE